MPQWGQKQGAVLPAPGAAGEVLTSTGADWESQPAATELPATGAAGRVLTSDGSAWVSQDLPAATESAPGIAETATQAEVTAGTDDQRFVSPLKLTTHLSTWPGGLPGAVTRYGGINATGNVDIVTVIPGPNSDPEYWIVDVMLLNPANKSQAGIIHMKGYHARGTGVPAVGSVSQVWAWRGWTSGWPAFASRSRATAFHEIPVAAPRARRRITLAPTSTSDRAGVPEIDSARSQTNLHCSVRSRPAYAAVDTPQARTRLRSRWRPTAWDNRCMTIQHYPKDGPQPPAPALDAKTLSGRFPAVIETAQRLGLHLYNVDTSCTGSNRSGGFDVLCSATFHERGIEFFCEASSGTLSIRASADNQQSDLGHAAVAEVLPCIATVFAELLGVPAGSAREHDCENALEELSRVDLSPHLAAADKRARDASAECIRLHADLNAARKRIAELEAAQGRAKSEASDKQSRADLSDKLTGSTFQAQIKGLEQARDFANRSRNEFKERVSKAIGLSGGEDEDSIVSHVVRVLGYTDELERREAALRMACARLVGWECPLTEPGVRKMAKQVDAVREGLLATIGLTAEKLGHTPVLEAVKAAWSGEGVRAEERIARVGEGMADLLKSHRELEQVVMGLKDRNSYQAQTIQRVAEIAGVQEVTLENVEAGVQAVADDFTSMKKRMCDALQCLDGFASARIGGDDDEPQSTDVWENIGKRLVFLARMAERGDGELRCRVDALDLEVKALRTFVAEVGVEVGCKDNGNTLTVFEQVRAVAKEWRWFGELLRRTRRPQDLAFFSSLEGRKFLLTAVSPVDGA